MIVGVGNDIVSVRDIKESIECSNRFLQRVFCFSEREYCNQQSAKFKHYAGCFAVKEAVMKALGTGWNHGIQWNHIELKHYSYRKPQVVMHDQAKKQADLLQVKNIYISLSYSEKYAVGVVILEK